MKTLLKIFGWRLRRPKSAPAQRVQITYSDGRPDLHMTLPSGSWALLSWAYAMEMDEVVITTPWNDVVVNLRHILALSHEPVEVLER